MERKKTVILGYLKDILQSRVQGWDKKTLSKGGKEILLKMIAQAVPTYAMGVFLLPLELCKDLERIMCRYWWKTGHGKDRVINWLSWKRLSKRKSEGGMGFRNIHEFNIAMVGKKGWRLMTHPNSLVARVYKARYYLNGTFLLAKLGGNPSYIQRSVIAAQELLSKGSVRTVGNGESVFILGEPWLPHNTDPFIHTVNEGLQGKLVSSLFAYDANGWDTDLLNDMFDQRDVHLIEMIPIRRNKQDSWYWKNEKLGHYSIKSAYLMMQNNEENNHSSNNFGFWRKMWNLKVPPKIKNFIWRAATECLSTKDRLRAKMVDINSMCPSCNAEPETVLHTLVTCSLARACWDKVGMSVMTNVNTTFLNWLDTVLNVYKGQEARMKVMVCWALWKARNELVWNQKGGGIIEILTSATSVLNQWSSAQDKNFDRFMGFMTQEDGDEHWTLPVRDTIKLNIDAAIFEKLNCYSFSLVARNHRGEVIDASAKCIQCVILSDMDEIMGIREALSWIKTHLGTGSVIETDSLVSVQVIRSSTLKLSYLGRIFEDCKMLLGELKDKKVSLRFVRRSANKVAHFIARNTTSPTGRSWRGDNTHADFIHVIQNDLKV